MPTVTLQPSGQQFQVEEGESILTAALRQQIVLPYGCRNGACGSCKGKLLEGRIDYGAYQKKALTDEEKAQGKALFCQAKLLSDVVIEARTVGAAKDIVVKTLPCRVQRMERLAPDVMVLGLKLPANERLQFLAGQYIEFLLKDGSRRSFSMANAPHSDDLLELHIRNYGGAFSQHAFERMKPRDILRFEGPFGSFFLREEADKPMILLASGTGLAPFLSILQDFEVWQRFARIPLGSSVPHPTTLMKITTRCGPAAVDGLNEALLAKAAAAKVLRTNRVRADTTVVEADVAYPTA